MLAGIPSGAVIAADRRPRGRAPRDPGTGGRDPERHEAAADDGERARRGRVHQVLATLGYGDAIGHEVLGIQRVLRAAGYDSEIFVETADPRLEDLTIDYREMVGEVAPEDVLIHHFSIGSRASRVAYALPGRMALVYHNITPPEYFVGVHTDLVKLCFRGRRELTAYVDRCDLALGDSEYNREELAGARLRADRRPAGRARTSRISTSTPNRILAADFDDGWTNIMFVGRVIPNKKFETIIRAFHVYRTRHNPRSRLLLVGSYSGFERYLAMLHALIARLGTPDVHFLGHVSNEELTALYDVADLFLCASEHEGFCVPIIEAFYKRVPVLAYASTAVPATMDGGGVLYDTTDPLEIARLMAAVLDDAGARGRRRRVAGRGARAPADARLRRHAARVSSTRCCSGRRGRRPTSRGTSGPSSISSSGSRSCASSGRRCSRRCRSAREIRGSGLGIGARSGPGARTSANRSRSRGSQPRAAEAPEPRAPAAMIINQWVPAAHRGDAIGDSARRVRDMLRRAGHSSDIFALTIDDDLRGDVRPFADPAARRGDVTIFHFALPSPMTEAFAHARRRARPPVPQHHAGVVLRAVRRRSCSGWRRSGRQELASLVGQRRSRARRLRVQPAGARGARVRADRRAADRGRHRAHHQRAAPRPALEKILGDGLINILFVGRIVPNKRIEDHIRLAEVYKRYVDSYYRFIFVGRYDGVPALLRADPRADRRVPDAAGPVLVHRARCRTRIWPRSTAGPTSTSR